MTTQSKLNVIMKGEICRYYFIVLIVGKSNYYKPSSKSYYHFYPMCAHFCLSFLQQDQVSTVFLSQHWHLTMYVCMYVYIYVCMYIYIYIYIYIFFFFFFFLFIYFFFLSGNNPSFCPFIINSCLND